MISALLGSIHATDDTRKNKNETWQMNVETIYIYLETYHAKQSGSVLIFMQLSNTVNPQILGALKR